MMDFNRNGYPDYAVAGADFNQNRNPDYLLYSA
jgi:hypothetical protein